MLVAENLIKCQPYYRGLYVLWGQQKVDPRDRSCLIVNRATRMVYQFVGGRQVWRRKGVQQECLLNKLCEFHQNHHRPIEQSIRDLHQVFARLPKGSYADEAKQLAAVARMESCGPKSIDELLFSLLIRLGVVDLEEANRIRP